MNANPSATTILCYGDSNTWGQKPDGKTRYAADVRWTGVLQHMLGDGFYVIEEGLPSRTTNLEHTKPGRNGLTYLRPCLESHNPLDFVILMLGTNDLKTIYNRSAQEVGEALRELIDVISETATNQNGQRPKVLLVSPILIDDSSQEFRFDNYDHKSAGKSKALATFIQKVADETGCGYLDASTVAHPGTDGLHMSKDSHPRLAKLIAEYITTNLK